LKPCQRARRSNPNFLRRAEQFIRKRWHAQINLESEPSQGCRGCGYDPRVLVIHGSDEQRHCGCGIQKAFLGENRERTEISGDACPSISGFIRQPLRQEENRISRQIGKRVLGVLLSGLKFELALTPSSFSRIRGSGSTHRLCTL